MTDSPYDFIDSESEDHFSEYPEIKKRALRLHPKGDKERYINMSNNSSNINNNNSKTDSISNTRNPAASSEDGKLKQLKEALVEIFL